ncbi:hypothetical protein [Psychrobacillus sp. BM2]|uniref:hypothetical protein n=1 Tax=Psychrobacillus sp. BM2 TaxID=3400421 RepID=UPI003B020119
MNKSRKFLLIIVSALIVFFILFYFINQDTVIESTTENIQIISKAKTSEEQWIMLSSNKKIYIENFSIWALIEENQDYTVVYDLLNKTKRYQLITIVPGDYKGQF